MSLLLPILSRLARLWPYAAGAALVLGIWAYAGYRGHARAAEEYQARIDRLQSEIATRTAQAESADIRHARAVEQTRAQISNEVSHEYQTRLAAVRARLHGLRAAPEDAADHGEGADLPRLPDAAGRPDAAAAQDRLPYAAALTATEQAVQLDALQQWLRKQQEVVE